MGLSNYIASSRIAQPGVCTSSTRPASPYEGQVIYTTDLDTLEIWNGSAWRILGLGTPTNGAVLQTVYAQTSTAVTYTSTTYISTGLSASITPKSTSSIILVEVVVANCFKTTQTNTGLNFQLRRGGSSIAQLGSDFLRTEDAQRQHGQFASRYKDSPSSTSALTYEVFGANRTTGTDQSNFNGDGISSITLQEIAA
jgi:hypothetical protein